MNLSKHWAAVLDDYVIDLAWSPDGAVLAAASAAGGITLFDAATGAVRHKLAGHENGTNCLAWAPRQKTEDREQNTAPTGKGPASEPRPLSSVPCPPSSDLLASGGQDGCVRFWSAATGQQTAEAKLGSAWVEHLAWQPVQTTEDRKQKTVPSGDQSSSVLSSPSSVLSPPSSALRPLSSVSAPPPLNSQPSTFNSPLLFAAGGRKLVALGGDGSLVHAFKDAPKTISALAWRPDGSACAAACFGGVCVWEAGTFAAQKEYVYGNSLLALTWSPNGRWLVAGCQDNAVHLWAPAEDIELHMSGYEAKLKELSFSPDSKWLATGGGRDACVWDCAGAGPADREPLLLPHEARVCALAFQQTHNVVVTAAANGEFCLWAPTHKNPLLAEVKMPSAATKFAWRADDSLLAAGTEQGGVFVFKL
jgi:WD40 repeat protein